MSEIENERSYCVCLVKVWHWLGRVVSQQSKDGSNRHDTALALNSD